MQNHGLPTDGSADFVDPDSDGANNWQEWLAGTDPLDPASVFKFTSITNSPPTVQLVWQSVPTRRYDLERSSDLSSTPAFSVIASNILGKPNLTSFTNSVAGPGPYFYRLKVHWP